MSDLLIKGMEMPRTHPITVEIYPDGTVLSKTVGRMDIHGKAVPVPPHGRLADIDAVISVLEEMSKGYPPDSIGRYWISNFFDILKAASTIIPAEEVKES